MEPIAVFYIGVAVGVAGASLAFPPRSARILGLFNLASCLFCNALQLHLPAVLGLDPLSTLDVLGGSIAVMLWIDSPRRRWPLIVAAAFGLQVAFHVAFALDLVGRLNYRRALNVLFLVQEVTILAGAILGRRTPGRRPRRRWASGARV